MSIATNLYTLRVEHGYSQDDLAQIIGISRQAISKWERAESIPDTDNLLALSQLYGVTIDELVKGSQASEGVKMDGEGAGEAQPMAPEPMESEGATPEAVDAETEGIGCSEGEPASEADGVASPVIEGLSQIPCEEPVAQAAGGAMMDGALNRQGGADASLQPEKRKCAIIVIAFCVLVVIALIELGVSLMPSSADDSSASDFPAAPAAPLAPAAPVAPTLPSDAWMLGGDAFYSAQTIMLEGEFDHNLFAAAAYVGGADVTVGSDAFLAGQTVNVSGWDIGNALFAAGEYVHVEKGGSDTTSQAVLCAGSEVSIDGTHGIAIAAGQHVTLLGTFHGDVSVYASTVTVQDTAVIEGTLHVRADKEPSIAEGAHIANLDFVGDANAGFDSGIAPALINIFKSLAAMLAAAALLLLLLGDGLVRKTNALVRKRPAPMIASGLIAIVAFLPITIVLFVTIAGIRLGIAFTFAFIACCLLCTAFAAICLGRALLPHWNRWASGLLAAAAFALIGLAPIAGFILWLASMVFTLGALITSYWHWRCAEGKGGAAEV